LILLFEKREDCENPLTPPARRIKININFFIELVMNLKPHL